MRWLHVKWSDVASGSVVEVRRNGAIVFTGDPSLPTVPAGDPGVQMKIGIYKWAWATPYSGPASTTTVRVAYHDQLRVGDQTASAAAVAPR